MAAKKPAKVPRPKTVHVTPASTRGQVTPDKGADVYTSTAAPGTGASSLVELDAGSAISAVLLELAGEGKLPLTSALAAWQREQDRIANRAWRRPGGMARMGLV